ncbi:MAG: hypothetical protein OXI40_07005 [Chloroflexota bacterium]|nr:hypothetical protein [Chloroflexota bacterium]
MVAQDTVLAKTSAELRVERLTWFGLVGALVIPGILPDWLTLHNALTPFFAGFVLIASGIYQHRQKWTVGFSTWVAGTISFGIAIYNLLERPELDMTLPVVLLAVFVIGIGIFADET